MKALQTFHRISYLILLALTVILAIGVVIAVIQGDVGILTGGLAAAVFAVFAILQIICITLYQPELSVYKIGFYLMHVGLLILLAGLAAFAIAGESITVQVPVDNQADGYRFVQNEEGEEIDLGFAFRLDSFTVEKYQSGSDRYYKTDVTFWDVATHAQHKDYLEVNRTLRNNGWKLYLMSYSDGTANLAANGLASLVQKIYKAQGKEAGLSVIEQIYADLPGCWYSYYYFDEINDRFVAITPEEIATVTAPLWAYTVSEAGATTVYLTSKEGSFAESISATGAEAVAHVKETYPGRPVRYYYYDMGSGLRTSIDEDYVTGRYLDSLSVNIRAGESGQVSVYIMREALVPDTALSSAEGGSSLLAALYANRGDPAIAPQYRIYSPAISDYTATTEEALYSLGGDVKAYFVNMGDTAVIFVHPLSNVLLVKRDPGEYATLTGMILVMLGGFMMCFFGNHKKKAEASPAAPAPATETAETASTPKSQSSKKGGRKR